VQDPVALAHFVLGEQPGWDNARILAAMESGTSLALRIHPPVPVTVTYASAVVKRNGKVHFYADVHGNDRLLDAALRAREMARRAPSQPLPAAARLASESLHERDK
jgi:murein L,D-transpeptidase YcbB/YkuD